LNAGSSADPDGTIAVWSWSKISGPVQYFLSSPNAASSNLSNLVAGTYTFRLEVIDNDGATAADTISIKVNPAVNLAPVANAGPDASIVLPVNQTTLNGGGSIDPDGSINQYQWSKISGPLQINMGSPGSVYCQLTNLSVGSYTFRLVVTDNSGNTDDDTIQVTVLPAPNVAPVAAAGADTILFFPASSIGLNGSNSYDPDGTITGYGWVRVSGPGSATIINSNAATPTVTGLVAGVHTIQLTVTDNKGKTATDQLIITVYNALNRPPLARAGNDTTIAAPASVVKLNASQSSDADGSIVLFEWKRIKGDAGVVIDQPNSSSTTVSGLITGEYEFELTVRDNKGAKATDSLKIFVVNNFRYVEQLTLFPNPAREFIQVQCVSDTMATAVITILDLHGHAVKKLIVDKKQYLLQEQLFIHELKKGIYFVEVILGNNKKMIGKFIHL
jgi:hypothetical protein